jgi:hypothetical protein
VPKIRFVDANELHTSRKLDCTTSQYFKKMSIRKKHNTATQALHGTRTSLSVGNIWPRLHILQVELLSFALCLQTFSTDRELPVRDVTYISTAQSPRYLCSFNYANKCCHNAFTQHPWTVDPLYWYFLEKQLTMWQFTVLETPRSRFPTHRQQNVPRAAMTETCPPPGRLNLIDAPTC